MNDAEQKAFRVETRGFEDAGIYWTTKPSEARYAAWRHFSDVFDTRRYGFREFARDTTVRRAPEFDGAYRGRQGILPEYAGSTNG